MKKWIGVAAAIIVAGSVLLFAANGWCASGCHKHGKPEKIGAGYDLKLVMDKKDTINVNAAITVANSSEKSLKDVGFYLVPNAMNSAETPFYEYGDAALKISSISVNGEKADYQLDNNELLVDLEESLEPQSTVEVEINYKMRLPEYGMRLSQVENNYYLAHWYPMLGIYKDGWVIEDYDPKGESYDTGYGKYKVSYRLPKEYLVATSAEDGQIAPADSGTVEGENIKDFYMALLDPEEWETERIQADDTELRVFVPTGSGILETTAEMAADAYSYFEERIGDNPNRELDIIANDGYMEYPNVIEVASEREALESVLIHEIAHQWFYYLVTNDPFRESWLDESLTEFTSALYISDQNGDADSGFRDAAFAEEAYPTERYANIPLDDFEETAYYSTIYGKIPMLLKEFFEANGGAEAAFEFLSAYYNEFQYEQVDSETFKQFFEGYFEEDQSEFLDSWLK
ncbi:Peptidase family M1 [Planococcus massiliensis]|uniref:Peptidase family M1 n=1 Tax=Planococcus massiliensis TaxID=1499687 RepID=A0A098EMV3_9BACL|nr:M1 family metallopeptidase [Planococcus massiliensis]CEG22631.1 Peptidase family M1 [Planococcus massiliensis]